ncbi:ras-responsive element-binding protein 1-like [Tachysurus ichikawai]
MICSIVNISGREHMVLGYNLPLKDSKDDTSTHICPLCDKNCQSQHQLTMHIRQHNSETGTSDHSCSICGKCLSSASSLDRHMLVHSGERPYKCSVCGQTFTTNGNMHRASEANVRV